MGLTLLVSRYLYTILSADFYFLVDRYPIKKEEK